ncbi:MAG: hypothetical protein MI924_08455, partial [Chloroflexales bacterium]|nr:hypothetical protein [Chloroflexales bacterium]
MRGDKPLPGYSATDKTRWHWPWYAVDENFIKVRALSETHWRVWTTDGTRYDFTQALTWGWLPPQEPEYTEPYKWLLTAVTDRHNNQIVYDYQIDRYPLIAHPHSVQPSYHLRSINWGPGRSASDPTQRRYRVRFEVRARASATPGVDADWERSSIQMHGKAGAPHERYQLDRIAVEVFQDSSGRYDPMRAYTLRYAPSSASLYSDDVGRHANGAPQGQRVLTLTAIQRTGTAGGALPATRFRYNWADRGAAPQPRGGWNRLIRVDNGYGGQVEFTYERTWNRDLRNPQWPAYENYHRVTQLRRSDTSTQRDSRRSLTQYRYVNPALNDALHAATVVYAIDPPGPLGESRFTLARPEYSEFRGHQTVTERVYDGADTRAPLLHEQQSWFYQGDAAVCTGQLPPKVAANQPGYPGYDTASACFQAMQRHESWKGRRYQTEVRGPGGGTLLQRTQQTYAREELPDYGDNPGSNHYNRAGLWRAFTYAAERTETAIERATGAPTSKTTKYAYEAGSQYNQVQYGNLTTVEEYDQTGARVR